jgi:hypothetical protein
MKWIDNKLEELKKQGWTAKVVKNPLVVLRESGPSYCKGVSDQDQRENIISLARCEDQADYDFTIAHEFVHSLYSKKFYKSDDGRASDWDEFQIDIRTRWIMERFPSFVDQIKEKFNLRDYKELKGVETWWYNNIYINNRHSQHSQP